MKKYLLVIRWVVGLLFIFSGLIKANDPLGLSYKMQEFFEAWQLKGLHEYTLAASFGMNLLEVVAGVAVIVGWQMKRFSWLLLVLIVFFTFLTSYVLFSGKIHACGCFGDCVPLTPIQTFIKDIVLLLLILLLVVKAGDVKPMLGNLLSKVVLIFSFLAITGLQLYALKYLPLIDCLPYAKGKNILEGMRLPANAVPDSTVITFKYKKNGQEIEFDQNHFPDDLDSTYEFISRYDKVVRKGTGLPKITDFVLTSETGTDTTKAILSQSKYIMLFVKDFDNVQDWSNDFNPLATELATKKIPLLIVTADVEKAKAFRATKYAAGLNSEVNILSCDATVIKTAARVKPTCLIMGPYGYIAEKVSIFNHSKLNWVIKALQPIH